MSSIREVERLLVELPAGDTERAELRAQANRYATECGCRAGGFFLAVSIVLVPAWILVTGNFGARTLAEGAAVVLAATVVGKAGGMLVGRVRLALLRASLARRVSRARPGYAQLR
jgi:hypothetical protein